MLAILVSDGVSYVFSGPDGSDLEAALESIHALFGPEQLLLEGGGTLNGTFFEAGLIDEFSTLIFPMIDGMTGIPSIVDYAGGRTTRPAGSRSFRLIANETLEEGVVWLRH